jgi:L-fuculose-phosphate aldolase/L-ribulose-5-phosphate 4-epimerase
MSEYYLKGLARFVVGTEGNVSYRDGDHFRVKESGTSLEDARFVTCDLSGKPLKPKCRPSLEADFHSLVYRNSDYEFVAHTHPTNTLKILCSDNELIRTFAVRRLFPDQVVFNGVMSCVVPYATPGAPLAAAIEGAVKEWGCFPRLLLLKNHGIVCCGYSMKEILVMTEICEKAAEVLLGATNVSFLSNEQVTSIWNDEGEAHRKSSLQ